MVKKKKTKKKNQKNKKIKKYQKNKIEKGKKILERIKNSNGIERSSNKKEIVDLMWTLVFFTSLKNSLFSNGSIIMEDKGYKIHEW